MTSVCPTCGVGRAKAADLSSLQFCFATGEVEFQGHKCRMQPGQIHILEVLMDAHPRKVRMDEIIAEFDGHTDTSVTSRKKIVNVRISQMRRIMLDGRLPLRITSFGYLGFGLEAVK